jgi:hypothetical protein
VGTKGRDGGARGYDPQFSEPPANDGLKVLAPQCPPVCLPHRSRLCLLSYFLQPRFLLFYRRAGKFNLFFQPLFCSGRFRFISFVRSRLFCRRSPDRSTLALGQPLFCVGRFRFISFVRSRLFCRRSPDRSTLALWQPLFCVGRFRFISCVRSRLFCRRSPDRSTLALGQPLFCVGRFRFISCVRTPVFWCRSPDRCALITVVLS